MGIALEKAASDWIAHLKVLGRLPRSIELRERRLGAVIKFFINRGCLKPADVTATDIDAFIQDGIHRGLARETLRSFRSTIRGFFDWLFDNNKIIRNPSHDIVIGKRDDQPLLAAPLSESDVVALLEAIPTHTTRDLRNRGIVELLYGCGLRLNEALTIKLTDLNLEVGLVTIHGKGNIDAQVPLLPSVIAVLNDYLAVRRELVIGPDCGLLFLSAHGKQIPSVTFQQWVNRLGKKVMGRRVHPHLFRRSIAVHLLRRGLDIRYVQSFLRHADLDVTKQYLRLIVEYLREDYDLAMPNLAPDCFAD